MNTTTPTRVRAHALAHISLPISSTMSVISGRNRQHPVKSHSTSQRTDLTKNLFHRTIHFLNICEHFGVRVPLYLSVDCWIGGYEWMNRWACFSFPLQIASILMGVHVRFAWRKHVPPNGMVSIQHNKALDDCVFRTMLFLLLLLLLARTTTTRRSFVRSLATLPCHSLFTFDSQISVHFRCAQPNSIWGIISNESFRIRQKDVVVLFDARRWNRHRKQQIGWFIWIWNLVHSYISVVVWLISFSLHRSLRCVFVVGRNLFSLYVK